MRTRRAIVVGMIAATALLLTSCGSLYQYAWGLKDDDVVGSWSTPNPLGTQIVLEKDGTFHARAWPANLSCQGTQAARIDDLDADPTEVASGTWRFFPGDGDDVSGGLLPGLGLYFSDFCEDVPVAFPTHADDGSVILCFPLDDDPDSFTSSRMFPFARDPAVTEASC